VRYAIAAGIPANRLSAAGFADNQPIDTGDSDDAYQRNRRIELKLTQR
jgi:chemotaxis protein MotB